MEPASKIELPKAKAPEAKPASAPPPKDTSSEKPADGSPKAELGTPRATLEQIAAGTPVAEATKPQETLPSREQTTALLTEANEILLDIKDMRLWVNALATQAADTPLGNEVRLDALRNILTIDTASLPPESANRLTDLKTKIKDLNIPAPKPGESALLPLIARYNEQNASNPVPESIIESIKTGNNDAAETVSQLLATNNDMADLTWKELTGVDGFTKLTPSPEAMLDLAGLPKTPENVQKAQEVFGISAAAFKEPGAWKGDIAMGIMYAALFFQFFNAIALGEGSGHH